MAQTTKKIKKTDVLTGHAMKPGVYYKFFRKVHGKLVSPFAANRTLQERGDCAAATGELEMCSNGWHAFDYDQRSNWLNEQKLGYWRRGTGVVYRVRLYGRVLKDFRKYCARGVRLLGEVEHKSREGRRLRQ